MNLIPRSPRQFARAFTAVLVVVDLVAVLTARP